MNGVPKIYKLIGAHGRIRAPCESSLGNAIWPVPHNICLIFLSDFGSSITTKVTINHPMANVHYGLYLSRSAIEDYLNNPLGGNVPPIFKNATILVDGHMYQDMALSMPPNPQHVDERVKRFPHYDYEKGIYNLPLDPEKMRRLGTAHKNGGSHNNLTRFDLLEEEYGQQGPGVVRFMLSTYVRKLSANGGGYVIVDACRVVTGGGRGVHKGEFTLYRNGLTTHTINGFDKHVNVHKHPQLSQDAAHEASDSAQYKLRGRPGVGVRRGLRPIHKNQLSKLSRANTENGSRFQQMVRSLYNGSRAPTELTRSRLLRRFGLSPSRYIV